jgi:hypothetical protein
MILTHLICSNFIIYELNTKQLTAQHIPFLGLYIAAIAASFLGASGRLHGTILQDRCEVTPDSRLCGFLATVQLDTLLCSAAFSPQISAEDKYLTV